MVDRDGVALPDYDGLSVETLRHRIRSLTEVELSRLLDYERAHADRTAVKALLAARLAELDSGAEPSSAVRKPPGPAEPPATRSAVGPQTAGPPVNPPPHGEPAQPARPTANR